MFFFVSLLKAILSLLPFYSLANILYSAKWWWGKTLANLVNMEQFAKVLPIQIYITKLQVD